MLQKFFAGLSKVNQGKLIKLWSVIMDVEYW